MMKPILLLLCLINFNGCQEKTSKTTTNSKISNSIITRTPIANYVVSSFQDSKGNLWFGTLEKGVAKYDGKQLVFVTTKDGLPSNSITAILEDSTSTLWFGTGAGISQYDGQSFINYSESDGLCSDMVSQLYIDSNDRFWIGTWDGVCTFDGKAFKRFDLPIPVVDTPINPDTKGWITEIMEDSKGNIWTGRDGYGALKFDGREFKHHIIPIPIMTIIEDLYGNIWLGGAGGLYRIDKDGHIKHMADDENWK